MLTKIVHTIAEDHLLKGIEKPLLHRFVFVYQAPNKHVY